MYGDTAGTRAANRRDIANMSSHDIRVAIQQIETPAFSRQFDEAHRGMMRADLNNEISVRQQIVSMFASLDDYRLETMYRHMRDCAQGNYQFWQGIQAYPVTFIKTVEEFRREAARFTGLNIGMVHDPVVGPAYTVDFEAYHDPMTGMTKRRPINRPRTSERPMRPRFKKAKHRRLDAMEESVPVEQYGTNEYE